MKNNGKKTINLEKKQLIFALNQVPPIFPICPKNSHFLKLKLKIKNFLPQVKQQPQTPVQSPLPTPIQQQQQQQQQHSHLQQLHSHADLLATAHGTDPASLNLVSALTAAINASSKGAGSGSGGGGGGSTGIRNETSDLQAKFKSEIQTKFPGKRFFFLSFFLYILL